MKSITINSTLFDVVSQNIQLLPILNRFNIKIGFGNTTVEKICSEKNINTDFFLEILNIYNNEKYFPQEKLIDFSANLIVEYLQKTHKYYYEYIIPQFEEYIELIKKDNKNSESDIDSIKFFYSKYKKELIQHIEEEENIIFPYILKAQEVIDKITTIESFRKIHKDSPIAQYERDHDDMEEKMNDLKNIIIKYMPEGYNQNLLNSFLFYLVDFEIDLNNHSRIEDKILVPKIKKIEELLSRS